MPQFPHLLNTGFLLWENTAEKELHKHRPVFVFLMHFKAKFSSIKLEKKQPETFLSTGLSCFLIPCCPGSSPRTTLKENLCHAASPPNTHHLDTATAASALLILACWLQISVPLVLCCKILIHTLLSKYCGFSCATAQERYIHLYCAKGFPMLYTYIYAAYTV